MAENVQIVYKVLSETANEDKCLIGMKKLITDYSKELIAFEWLLNDRFLLHFVRGKKYNADKAASAMKNYFYIRRHQYKSLFLELSISSEAMLKNRAITVLKHRDEQQRAIILVQFPLWSDDNTIDDFTKAMIFLLEECWNCLRVEIGGIQIIAVMKGFGWHHFKIFNPLAVYKAVNIFWNNMPIRYKFVHLVNSGVIVETSLKAVKPFLPFTLRKRLVVHPSNYSELHKIISSEILPPSLGGDMDEEDAYDTELLERIYEKEEHYERFISSL